VNALGDVRLVGVDWHTATKLLYTLVFFAGLVVLRWAARQVVRLALRGRTHTSARFWARQGVNLATAVLVALGLVSIWFDNGLHAAAAIGLLTAGAAFALQKAITSLAGYFLILRGDIFTVGDRIVMGGVRGDVIGLGFLRTTILEMGQPAGDEDDDVPVWVDARQYTGRVVTVTNSAVFDEPIFNYSREFTFLWEEIRVQITHESDHRKAERILLHAALEHSKDHRALGVEALQRMRRRFYVPNADLEPAVFYKLNSSWVELAVRFIVPTHGIRQIKSAISRQVLEQFQQEGIEFASTTIAITELPSVKVTGADASDGADADGSVAYPDERPAVGMRLPENER
jgi:small-conductance mechanosensitive channel